MVKVSIVIPVYNNWDYTEKCLESVFRLTKPDKTPFEVVVVDDNSKDGTYYHIKKFSSQLENLAYLRNEENLGFSGSCNKGAAHAKGEYLIFLNNDAVVTEDWAEQLLNTISSDRDIWIAGAKCLYPDGTIQHAGVAFPEHFRYHLGHIYRSAPGKFPLSDYEKDYPCVTAACMIMRKEDFHEVGGFDMAYRNGFEDVDLCLKVIEKGKRIRYQPRCEIIHYESKSESRFDRMRENKKILLERWEDFIKSDETLHIRQDIKHSLNEGLMKQVGSWNLKSNDNRFVVSGNYRKKGKGLSFLPGNPENKISISIPEPDKLPDYLLITGKTRSEKDGRIILNYLTGAGEEYSQVRSFVFRTYKGENNFYFPVYHRHLKGQLVLDLSWHLNEVVLEDLDIYTFDSGHQRKRPSLTAIIYGNGDNDHFAGYVDELRFITACESISFHKVTFNGQVNEPSPFGTRIEYASTHCKIEDLSAHVNKIIENSDSEYIYVTPGIASVDARHIEEAIEIMETDPEIGLFFGAEVKNETDRNPDAYSCANILSEILSGTSDLPVLFRNTAWSDAGGYQEGLEYYLNNDLCLSILSKANWRSCIFEIGTRGFQNANEHLPLETYTRLKHFQQEVKKRHADFLLNLCMNGSGSSSTAIKRYYGQRYHDTLLGSLKVHFNHFIYRRVLKRSTTQGKDK